MRRRNLLRSFDDALERSIAYCVYLDHWMTLKLSSSIKYIEGRALALHRRDSRVLVGPVNGTTT